MTIIECEEFSTFESFGASLRVKCRVAAFRESWYTWHVPINAPLSKTIGLPACFFSFPKTLTLKPLLILFFRKYFNHCSDHSSPASSFYNFSWPAWWCSFSVTSKVRSFFFFSPLFYAIVFVSQKILFLISFLLFHLLLVLLFWGFSLPLYFFPVFHVS